VSAIWLLDGVMIIISYTLPTITISLSLSIWAQSQCKRRLVASTRIRNISPICPVIANFVNNFQIFVIMVTEVGLR